MAPAAHQRHRGRSRLAGIYPVWAAVFVLVAGWGGYVRGQTSQPDQKPSNGITITNIEAGFFDGAYNVVRPDAYAPITVQIHNRTGARFNGTLQVLSKDRDGETVIYELPGFGVDSGLIDDKQFGFFARNPGTYASSPEVTVRLLDSASGRLVASETTGVKFINESDLLVLDISPQSIKPVIQAALPNDAGQHFHGQVQTAYSRPERLPQFWHELEAVDVIVCDQPDDLGVDEKSAMLKVLAQWVRQGGLLVLGPGTLQSFGESDLGKALPGRAAAVKRLPRGKAKLEGLNTSLTVYVEREAGIWQLQPKEGASVLLGLPQASSAPALVGAEAGAIVRAISPVVLRRRLGLGAIVQSGVSLKMLLASSSEEANKAGGSGTRIKPEIFGIRSIAGTDLQASRNFGARPGWPNRLSPGDLLVGQADFRATGTVLAMLLMLLIALYGLVATVGTWVVLKRRNLAQFSWLAFAGAAIIGSVGAAMLVQGARGISADVKQESVIDIDGASGMAHIRTLYGLKMPYDARVDVGVTTVGREDLGAEELADAYIRPASDFETSNADSSFAVRRDYTIPYGRPELSNVPVRATAKQFESYWYGPLGAIQASLREGATGQLAAGSSITNNTNLNLYDCYLVYATTNSFSRGKRGDSLMSVVRIDSLPAGKTRSDLAGLADALSGQDGSAVRLGDMTSREWWKNLPMDMPGARSGQGRPRPVTLTDTASRMMTATMVSVLCDVPSQAEGMFAQQTNNPNKVDPFTELTRQGAHWVDLRNVLDGRSALLVGVADAAGPMRLKVNGRSVLPSSAECIVRVVLPFAAANWSGE